MSDGRNARPVSSEHIPELDGVRATAIWMVLVAHLGFAYPPPAGALLWMPSVAVKVLGHGWLGVDLFFVLSGFLITGILLDSRNRPQYFQRFYGRRALRILPVYFASVGIASLFYAGAGRYFLLSSLFMANLAGVLSVAVPHGPGVLWSLAVEEHFYLAWPWLVRLTGRRTLGLVAAAIVLATPVLRGLAASRGVRVEEVIYPLSIFRFDGLALGALLALWWRSEACTQWRSLQIVAGLLAADVVLTAATAPFGGLGSATPVGVAIRYTQAQWFFAAGMLAILACRGARWTALFRSRFMILSGELSYCIYLIHLSLADGYMAVAAGRIEPAVMQYAGPDTAMAVRVLTLLTVTFGIAWLSRSYLERPFLSLKRHLA